MAFVMIVTTLTKLGKVFQTDLLSLMPVLDQYISKVEHTSTTTLQSGVATSKERVLLNIHAYDSMHTDLINGLSREQSYHMY